MHTINVRYRPPHYFFFLQYVVINFKKDGEVKYSKIALVSNRLGMYENIVKTSNF